MDIDKIIKEYTSFTEKHKDYKNQPIDICVELVYKHSSLTWLYLNKGNDKMSHYHFDMYNEIIHYFSFDKNVSKEDKYEFSSKVKI